METTVQLTRVIEKVVQVVMVVDSKLSRRCRLANNILTLASVAPAGAGGATEGGNGKVIISWVNSPLQGLNDYNQENKDW